MSAMKPPRLDPVQLKKRMLLFYFAAGVNLLMGFWVMSVGGQAGGGTVTAVMLVFLAFAGINYYLARKIGKYLRRLSAPAPSSPADDTASGK